MWEEYRAIGERSTLEFIFRRLICFSGAIYGIGFIAVDLEAFAFHIAHAALVFAHFYGLRLAGKIRLIAALFRLLIAGASGCFAGGYEVGFKGGIFLIAHRNNGESVFGKRKAPGAYLRGFSSSAEFLAGSTTNSTFTG